MQVSLSGRHVEVTPALRTYVEEKLQRLERHYDNLIDIHVVVSVEKLRQHVEATVHYAGGTVFAEQEHEDMYAAIDLMVDKLDTQIRRQKERRTDHHRAEGSNRGQA